MPAGKRFTDLPPAFNPGDKIRTAAGLSGIILGESRNTFLLRPATRCYSIQLDSDGAVIVFNEQDIEKV